MIKRRRGDDVAVAGGCSRRRVDGLPVVVVEGADAERALRALGDALRGVAYPETPTELQPLEAVLSVVARQGAPGSDVLDSSRRGDWPPLARMFAFNEPITIELFEEVVGSVGLVALQRLGLVSRDGGCVRAQVRAQRVGERFVLTTTAGPPPPTRQYSARRPPCDPHSAPL